jgi:1-acyl-sn-glycerol-3-phosphate acyltransferase
MWGLPAGRGSGHPPTHPPLGGWARPARRGTWVGVAVLGALLFYAVAAAVIALSLPLTVLVRLATLPFDPLRKAPSATLRGLGRLLVHSLPFWRVKLEGSFPAGTFVVVPNHQSMADALAVACLPGEVKWMGKESAFRFPWLGWAFHVAGYVPVLRGDRQSGSAALARMRRYLDAGLAVGLFPEGTRTRDGALQPFRAGPFKLAIDAGVPVVPVVIDGAWRAMPADQPWIRPARIRVTILPPIPTAGLRVEDLDRLREETRQRIAAALAPPA